MRSGWWRIRGSISRFRNAAARAGIDHLGIQVESDEELTALREQVAAAQIAAQDQPNAECCYARSDKYWTTDPQGIAWETFHTLDAIPVYGETKPRASASLLRRRADRRFRS